jgi:hypothetical protein
MRGHHADDRVGRLRADVLEQRQAVDARHTNVGQHDVDEFAPHDLTRDLPILRNQHFIAVALKENAQPLPHRLLIVGNQNAREGARHRTARRVQLSVHGSHISTRKARPGGANPASAEAFAKAEAPPLPTSTNTHLPRC